MLLVECPCIARGDGPETCEYCGGRGQVTKYLERIMEFRILKKEDQKKRYACVDCGELHECWMVVDALWRQYVGMPRGICVCYQCFEKRLGRKLTSADLKQVPSNTTLIYLLKRLEALEVRHGT